jgi:hypothetical protein
MQKWPKLNAMSNLGPSCILLSYPASRLVLNIWLTVCPKDLWTLCLQGSLGDVTMLVPKGDLEHDSFLLANVAGKIFLT